MPSRKINFLVPLDCKSGDNLQLSVGGHRIAVKVPSGAEPGSTLQIEIDAPEQAFNTIHKQTDEGSTYTSGEDGESSFGPTMLNPSEWHRRYPQPSTFRSQMRPFRTHHFHNQKDSKLYKSSSFEAVLASPIDTKHQVERVTYASVTANANSFDPYCIGEQNQNGIGRGKPVVLTNVPGAKELMDNLCVATLKHAESPLGRIPVRICKAFKWGKQEIEGRMPLQDYFRLVTKHSKADVPFYIFEDDIGGKQHTTVSYHDVDQWATDKDGLDVEVRQQAWTSTDATSAVSQLKPKDVQYQTEIKSGLDGETENIESDGSISVTAEVNNSNQGRKSFSDLYHIPSLFSTCMLRVPKLLRPTSTDGVLLIGCKRSGSYPHIDPAFTAAWNWMIDGVKRWVLFPPNVSREVICGNNGDNGNNGNNRNTGNSGNSGNSGNGNVGSDEKSSTSAADLTGLGAAYWWSEHYPRLKKRADELGMVEVLQQPGELIYVPAGWWHSVVNVTEWTVAVTHNLVMPRAFRSTFHLAVEKDAIFARRWWRCLRAFVSEAAEQLLLEENENGNEVGDVNIVEKCIKVTKGTYGKYGKYECIYKTVIRIDKELTDGKEFKVEDADEDEDEDENENELPAALSLFGNLSSDEEDDC